MSIENTYQVLANEFKWIILILLIIALAWLQVEFKKNNDLKNFYISVVIALIALMLFYFLTLSIDFKIMCYVIFGSEAIVNMLQIINSKIKK